jgi:hypothetical protein
MVKNDEENEEDGVLVEVENQIEEQNELNNDKENDEDGVLVELGNQIEEEEHNE